MGTISQDDLTSITALVKKNKIEDASEFELASRGLHYASSNYSRVYNIYNKKVQAINLDYSNGKLTQTSYQSELGKLRKDMEPLMAQWQKYNDLLAQMMNKFQSEITTSTPPTISEESLTAEKTEKQRKRKITKTTENLETAEENIAQESEMKRSKMVCLSDLTPSSRPSNDDIVCFTSGGGSKKSSNEAEDVVLITKSVFEKNRTSVAVSTEPRFFFVPPDHLPVSFYANYHETRQRNVPIEVLNEVGVQIIIGLCDEGYSVSWENVLQRLFLHYRVTDLAHLGLKRATDIPCLQHLMKVNERIHLYMKAYSFLQPVGTLFDLDRALAQLFNKNSFDDLCIGPLVKHPHVYEVFKFPTDLSLTVPQITVSDILFHLHKYLSDNKLWNTSVSLSDFLEFLKREFKVSSPYELGVRIKGLGLAISSIKSVQRTRKQVMDKARDRLRNEIKRMCENEVAYIKRELEEKFCRDEKNVDPVSVAIKSQKRRYATLDSTAVLVDIIETCRILFESKPFFKKLREFLYQIQNDQLLRKLFQVALCIGRMALPDDAVPPHLKKSFLANQRRTLALSSSSTSSSSETDEEIADPANDSLKSNKPIPEKPFESQILEFLKESSPLPLTISTLARVENRTLARFNFSSFYELHGHSFLEFLGSHMDLIEEHLPESLVAAVAQIPEVTTLSEENLKNLLIHYVEPKVPIKSLITRARSFQPSRTVIHELSLIDITSLPPKVSNKDGNLRQMALYVLYQCPLLEDLIEFSHWKVMFAPYLGDISAFLIKNSNTVFDSLVFDVIGLQTEKQLLRLTNKATLNSVEEALKSENPRKYVGLLVSFIAVQHCSLTHAPLALLTNMFHKALLSLSSPASFVLQCICCLPSLLLPSLVMRHFIEPLSRVEGSIVTVRAKLKNLCRTVAQKLRLEHIGLLFGITEWTSGFESRCMKVDDNNFLNDIPERLDLISTSNDGQKSHHFDYNSVEKEANNIPRALITDPIIMAKEIERAVESKPEDDDDSTFVSEKLILSENEINMNQYTHVEKIRRDKFGVGISLSEEGEQLAESLRKLVGRSLDRLSKELYSCDMHFVLELVQNADDNKYSKCQEPSVRFEITNDMIRVLNNEDGFTYADIEALCDVGKSTKGRHSQGYIGQKGIGFKSVFAITDRPEIHSGGYHINFDVNKGGPVGYILPEWMDSVPNVDTDWMTVILLPLKSETERQRHKARSLAASFRDIHPSLLLFLNRLNKLEIRNYVTNEHCTFIREKVENNVVKLHSTINNVSSVKEWIVIKRKLHVPEQMKPCLHVYYTEIAIALPKIPLHELRFNPPPIQDVFAFLPLRSFGMPFIVQADFDVPASRQDITSDSEWNQWLLLQFPPLFVENVYPTLRQIYNNNDVDAAEAFIRFMPSLSQTVGCFHLMAREILRLVRNVPLFPCIDSNNEIIWRTATQTTVVRDAFLRQVLTSDLLESHLHLNYLHEQIASLPSGLIHALGIHELEFRDVLEVLQSASPQKLDDIAGWLLCLARSTIALGPSQEEELINRLKALTIIPLSSGKLVSINECSPIFMPLFSQAEENQQLVLTDLNMIDHRLFDYYSDELSSSQVRSLLLQAGIKHVTPAEVIDQHILRIFSDDSWHKKSEDVLISYVIYIWNIWRRDPSIVDIEALKPHIQIKTTDGFRNPSRAVVNFPLSYGNRYNLVKDFSAFPWVLVDDIYLEICRPKMQKLSIADKMKWHSFFERFGVKDFLTVQQRKIELSRAEFQQSQWSAWFDFLSTEFTSFVIEDYYCEQFERLALAQDTSTVALFKAIEENWNSYYDKFKVAHLFSVDNQKIREMDSTFFLQLKCFQWIPATVIKYTEDKREVKEIKTLPSETFVSCPLFKKLFSHNVPYLNLERDMQSLFAQDLGLVQNIKPMDVLNKLILWSNEKTFFTSMDHISALYEFLWRSIDETTLRKAFDENSIIFVPEEQACANYDVYKGHFVDRRDACWSDPSGLFEKYNPTFMLHGTTKFHRILLLRHYKADFYDFFHRVVRVSDSPTIDEYVALLIFASQTFESEAIFDVFEIYETIGKRCAAALTSNNGVIPNTVKEHILDLIRGKTIFPIMDGRWVTIEEIPIIPDNLILVEKFGNKVPFLKIPNTKAPVGLVTDLSSPCLLFFGICNICRLTDVLEMEIVTEMLRPAPIIQNFAASIVPYVQLYMLRHFPDEYAMLKSRDFATQLRGIRFFSVGRLEVVYRLRHDRTTIVALPSKCCFQFRRAYVNEESRRTCGLCLIYANETAHEFRVKQSETDISYRERDKISYILIIEVCCNLTQSYKFFETQNEFIEFYIHRDSTKKYRDICQGLAELFSEKRFELTRTLANFMNLLKDELDNLETFSKYQDFSLSLPDNEVKWEIPLVNEPLDTECEEDFVDNEKVQALLQFTEESLNKCNQSTSRSNASFCWPPMDAREPPHAASTKRDPETSGAKFVPEIYTKYRKPEAPEMWRAIHSNPIAGHNNDTADQHFPPHLQRQEIITSSPLKRPLYVRSTELAAASSSYQFNVPSSDQNTASEDPSFAQRELIKDESKHVPAVGRGTFTPGFISFDSSEFIYQPETADESDFEPVTLEETSKDILLLLEKASFNTEKIGLWGETWVYEHLKTQHKEDISRGLINVQWLNENGETGSPFDFVLEYKAEEKKVYVEVKTTVDEKRQSFPISLQELRLALENPECYHVYRVYNGGNFEKAKLRIIKDLVFKMDSKSIRLFMVV